MLSDSTDLIVLLFGWLHVFLENSSSCLFLFLSCCRGRQSLKFSRLFSTASTFFDSHNCHAIGVRGEKEHFFGDSNCRGDNNRQQESNN